MHRFAELQATRNIPMTMQDWKTRLDAFLQFTEYEILHDSGKVTAEIALIIGCIRPKMYHAYI